MSLAASILIKIKIAFSKRPFLYLFFILWYFYFALPEPLFKTPYSTVILDRNDALLNVGISADEQYRFPVGRVPEKFKKAIICFEDQYFEYHPGISPIGIARAFYLNIKEQRIVSGASTLSMQVIRLMKGRKGKKWSDKCLEMILATRLELRYSKDEILALYAAHAPFGGNIVGIEAASWRYFGKTLEDLTWAEAATLAVLPNAPALIHPGKNRHTLLKKRNQLLKTLYLKGHFNKDVYLLSLDELLPDQPQPFPNHAFHLLQKYQNQHPKGGYFKTSIDLNIQKTLNNTCKWYGQQLVHEDIHNMALLLSDNQTGQIVAYIGNTPNVKSEDYYNDMIQTPRSTGSTLKPFLYAMALQKGKISTKAVLPDIPVQMGHYNPKNFDYDYEGLVPANEALYRSLNVPMVFLLQKYGLLPFHQNMKALGMYLPHEAQHYGMSLILGGAEISPWELNQMYMHLAQSTLGKELQYLGHDLKPQKWDHQYPISPSAAYLTFHTLSLLQRPVEEQAWTSFESAYRISWKTGTSYGFRDAWAVGSNEKYTLCVWVGNADGEGKPLLTGVGKAAPLLFRAFNNLDNRAWFKEPEGFKAIEICKQSGYPASDHCPLVINSLELEQSIQKTSPCPYHKTFYLHQTSGLIANRSCYPLNELQQKAFMVLNPVEAQYYSQKHPEYESVPAKDPLCYKDQSTPQIAIIYPKANSDIILPLDFDQKRSAFVAQLAHKNKKAVVQWFLDAQWVGETQHIHKLSIQCKSGSHTLSAIDSEGNETRVSFNLKLSTKKS